MLKMDFYNTELIGVKDKIYPTINLLTNPIVYFEYLIFFYEILWNIQSHIIVIIQYFKPEAY